MFTNIWINPLVKYIFTSSKNTPSISSFPLISVVFCFLSGRNKGAFYFLVSLLVFIGTTSCDFDNTDSSNEPESKILYSWENKGRRLYKIDTDTFEILKIIYLPDDFLYERYCLSTNREYLIFSAGPSGPPFPHYFMAYSIETDTVHSYFATGFDSVGAPRIAAAQIEQEPGLAYLYSHSLGLYSFDFLEQEIIECISEEHNQSLGKFIYHSPDNLYTAILKKHSAHSIFSEIEIYDTDSRLHDCLFVLNKDDKDGISVYDLVFSEDNKVLYISFQLSQGRSVGVGAYFGSYDLTNRTLYKSSLKFPWNLTPYYMAYSPKRKEAYLIGDSNIFYIIDVGDAGSYSIKDSVKIADKTRAPSLIVLQPDEMVAFVSCPYNSLISVIDLNDRTVLGRIELSVPYRLIIP